MLITPELLAKWIDSTGYRSIRFVNGGERVRSLLNEDQKRIVVAGIDSERGMPYAELVVCFDCNPEWLLKYPNAVPIILQNGFDVKQIGIARVPST